MDLLFIPLLAVCLWGARFRGKGFFGDYLSVEHTRAFRGILAVLVVLHHLYMEADTGVLHLVVSNLGVPCVVLFLFLSGYGLQKSFTGKTGYARTVFKRRVPGILVPFLVLVPVYWGLYALLGQNYDIAYVLKTLINGSPIVRYGWYTEAMLLLYLGFGLCAWLLEKRREWMGPGVLLMTAGVMLGLFLYGMPPFWYYSLPAFALGVLWADKENLLLPRMDRHYWLWLAVSFAVFGSSFAAALVTFRAPFYWITSWALVIFVLTVLRKCTFRNRALDFLGGLSFEIYSLHGFFMLLYRSDRIYIGSDLLWAAAVLASAIPAAWLLNRLLHKK